MRQALHGKQSFRGFAPIVFGPTRIRSMPPEAKCPWCDAMVPDWHFEWHTQQDQRDIFAGNKAMECPFCRAGAAFDGFVLAKAPSGRVSARRELRVAALWARNQNQSLAEYLKT